MHNLRNGFEDLIEKKDPAISVSFLFYRRIYIYIYIYIYIDET